MCCCIWIPILIGLISALIGGVIGWLLRSRRVTELENELSELNNNYDTLNKSYGELNVKFEQEHHKYLDLSTKYNVRREEVNRLTVELEDLKNNLSGDIQSGGKSIDDIKKGRSTDDLAAVVGSITGGKTMKDDLTKIEGIGPKINELLNNAGVYTFGDLASSKKEFLKKVLLDAGSRFQMHDPGTWPQQAELARDGKWDELKDLQDRLDGGKY